MIFEGISLVARPEFSLIKIDEHCRQDHSYLQATDRCYCLGSFVSGKGFDGPNLTNLMSNFKKGVERKALSEYWYKTHAIVQVADEMRRVIGDGVVASTTFVPAPSSRAKTDLLYDDRLMQVLQRAVANRPGADVRELLITKHTRTSMRKSDIRLSVDELYESIAIDKVKVSLDRVRKHIILFDDALVCGTTFKACQRHLNEQFPDSIVFGLFIARRVFDAEQDEQD